jgi:[acyl-carrier-protein] S-malonyltransferase
MGKDLAEAFPQSREAFAAVDAALGERLSALCFEGPADTLMLTHNAQPALLAHAAAVWSAVRARVGASVRAVAGHSLGEFSAHHAAGTFTLESAARIVRRRGQLMHAAGTMRPGAMAAILGETTRSVENICDEARRSAEGGLVVPANYNSPDQVVVSGDVAGVERAMELARAAGAKRAIRLAVSGAFHSPLMAPARDEFARVLADAHMANPTVPVYANVNAEPVLDAVTARRLLLEQLTCPVRWVQIIERLALAFPEAVFVEMGPGAVLAGLVKKIVPGIAPRTCGTAAEVTQLLAMASA